MQTIQSDEIRIFSKKNEVEIYLNVFSLTTGMSTQTELAKYFGVAQSAIAGWIKRNSIATLRKYMQKHDLDIKDIDRRVSLLIENENKSIEVILNNSSTNVSEKNNKYQGIYATLEQLASIANAEQFYLECLEKIKTELKAKI